MTHTSVEWTHNRVWSVGSTKPDVGFYLRGRLGSKLFFYEKLSGKFKEVK